MSPGVNETLTMKTFPSSLVSVIASLAVILAITLPAKEAHALGPIDIEVGAKVGYGSNPGQTNNPLGVGISARAGIGLFGLYGGLNLMDYIGSGDGLGGTVHALQFGGELGYSIKISILTIRPQIGLGNITLSDSTLQTNYGSLYVEPGGTVLLTFGLIFIGADANALIITNAPNAGSLGLNTSTQSALTVHGQVGISF
jgi:hypothetical protein